MRYRTEYVEGADTGHEDDDTTDAVFDRDRIATALDDLTHEDEEIS